MEDPTPILEPIEDAGLIEHFEQVIDDGPAPVQGLLSGTPSEVLRRVATGDPLEFMTASAKCIDDEALFIDPTRLCVRCWAIVAHKARFYDAKSPLQVWITDRLKAAVLQLLEDDWELDQQKIPPVEESDFAWIVDTMQVTPLHARSICVVFNSLPRRVRQAFYATMVQGIAVNRYVAGGNGPPQQVKQDVERALRAIAELKDPGSDRGNEA